MFLIPWPVVLPLNSPLPQLLSLNLSNNKLYRLDDLSSIVQKAPNLKILNLAGNEVSLRAQLCLDRVDRGGESLPRGSKRQGGHLRDGGEGGGNLAGFLYQRVFPAFPPCPLQLKSERELDKIKGLKLEELWLDGNTLCDTFRDQSTYIRSVILFVSPPGDLHPLGG